MVLGIDFLEMLDPCVDWVNKTVSRAGKATSSLVYISSAYWKPSNIKL